MCGRARQAAAHAYVGDVASRDAGVPAGQPWKGKDAYTPCDNLCPGMSAAVVRAASSDAPAALCTMRWGLVPPGTKTPDHWKMFNARSETISALPVFKRLLAAKRCAVPLDGFFEWTDDECKSIKAKQPWYVHARSGPLWLAGLYDCCDDLDTFTLLTRDVDSSLAWLHDRMPIILDSEGLTAWLAAGDEPPLRALTQRVPSADLAWHPTTKKMSKVEYQGEDCAVAVKLVSQQQRSVASFFGAKAEAKSEVKSEAKVEVKAEVKVEAKVEASAEGSLEVKSATPTASGVKRERSVGSAARESETKRGASSTPAARPMDGWLKREGGTPGSSGSAAPPAAQQDWAAQLSQLAAMGFGDEAANRSALDATGGNVEAAVAVLLA